MNMESAQPT